MQQRALGNPTNKAWLAGWDAGICGQSRGANPHRRRPQKIAWDKGCIAGRSRLRAEIERLRAALESITQDPPASASVFYAFLRMRDIASAALGDVQKAPVKQCPECKTPVRQIWIQEHASGCEAGRVKPLPFDDGDKP